MNNNRGVGAQSQCWIGAIVAEDTHIFARIFMSRQKAERAIVTYLCEHEEYDGDSFTDSCNWIAENDKHLDLQAFEVESSEPNLLSGVFGSCMTIKAPPEDHGDEPLFRVVYAIDVSGSDERQAAETAWQMMQAEDSLSPVLMVMDSHGKQTQLDLAEDIEFNKIIIGYVNQRFKKQADGKFKCILQDFIAGDDVQFENIEGESIEAPEHEYQPCNMTFLDGPDIINRLNSVLHSINVGGEQSRQFATEIDALKKLISDLNPS